MLQCFHTPQVQGDIMLGFLSLSLTETFSHKLPGKDETSSFLRVISATKGPLKNYVSDLRGEMLTFADKGG